MARITRRTFMPLLGAGLAAPAVLFSSSAGADEAIGTVVRLQNFASATTNLSDRVLNVGDPIFRNDRVFTGPDARLELSFVDETSLTLGGDATIEISSFVFDGTGGKAGWEMLAGAFAMTTGLIGKNNPENVAITTPVSTIGIRGTSFWGGPINAEQYGVLILDGAVIVTTAVGSVTLDDVGEGTKIDTATGLPSLPNAWSDDLVAQAVASITFAED